MARTKKENPSEVRTSVIRLRVTEDEVKKFKEKGEAGLEDRRGKRLKDQMPRTHEEELEIEIAKLKHELYMTKMERDVLKKLDEIERREAYRK